MEEPLYNWVWNQEVGPDLLSSDSEAYKYAPLWNYVAYALPFGQKFPWIHQG